MEDGALGIIAEGDVFELDRRGDVLQLHGVGLVGNGHRHVDHLKDAVPGGHGPLHDGVLHGEHPHRLKKPLHIEDEGDHDTNL